jgi:hypothetical protein
MTEQDALTQLREAYRDTALEVRFYPDALTSWRWQCGLNGGDRFQLLAWSATPGGLIAAIRDKATAQGRNGHV